ncbi:MAG: hypothetical protein UCH28_11300, partial [Adlercreutzia sp.]|nr:hypothetical protein [Adlercreutzia sp.]
RVLLRHTLPAGTYADNVQKTGTLTPFTVPASIDVAGVMVESVSDGDNNWYTNRTGLTYGKRRYVVDAQSGSFQQGGPLYSGATKEAKATIQPTLTTPVLTNRPISMYDGSGTVDSNLVKEGTWANGVTATNNKQTRPVLVETDNAGWRIRIGNTSTSRMAPAKLTLGPIADGIHKASIVNATSAMGLGSGQVVTAAQDPTVLAKTPYFVADRIRLGKAFVGTYDPDTKTYADDRSALVRTVTIAYYKSAANNADKTLLTKEVFNADKGQKITDVFKPELDNKGNRTGRYVLTLADLGLAAAGDRIYLSKVEIEMDEFVKNKRIDDNDYLDSIVEVLGTSMTVGDIPLCAQFSTDYENATGNANYAQEAKLTSMYIPIKPTVGTSYGYLNLSGTRVDNSAVPYRWGDLEEETAFFRYTLTNNAPYEIADFGMDFEVGGLTQQTESVTDGGATTAGSTVWRGFLTRNVVIPGFKCGDAPVYSDDGKLQYNADGTLQTVKGWYYQYGLLDSMDVFNQNNATGTIMNNEKDSGADSTINPDAEYDLRQAVKEIVATAGTKTTGTFTSTTYPNISLNAATGILTIKVATDGVGFNGTAQAAGLLTDATGKATDAPLKMVRLRFKQVNMNCIDNSGSAFNVSSANSAPVVYLTGRADTHTNVTSKVQGFTTTAAYGPTMRIGSGKREETVSGKAVNRLAASTTMTFGTFASTIDYKTTKAATERPNLGSVKTASNDGVEIANYAKNSRYDFIIKNTGLNRSDDATLTINMDDLSAYLPQPIGDVQGFWTKKLTFNEALFNFGSTVRQDNTPSALDTSLVDAVFYFRTVPEVSGLTSDPVALAATNRTYSQGAATVGTNAEGKVNADDGQGYHVRLTAAELQALLADAKKANASATEFTIDLTTDSRFAPYADFYLERIELRYTEIDPLKSEAAQTINLGLTGTANHWYKSGCQDSASFNYSRLCASAKLVQTQKLDKQAQSSAKTAHFKVYYPAMELHTYGQYGATYDRYMNNVTYSASTSDGTGTRTSVPYDRDFKMWVNLSNQRQVSTLDEVDVVINLPLSQEEVVQLDGTKVKDYVGFHTTKVTVNSELFETYQYGTVGSIKFTGYGEAGDDLSKAVEWTIQPNADYEGVPQGASVPAPVKPAYFQDACIPAKSTGAHRAETGTAAGDEEGEGDDGEADPAPAPTDDNCYYYFNDDGDLVITEEALREHGIKNLVKVELIAWQDMQCDDATAGNIEGTWQGQQNVEFQGFADQNFGAGIKLTANSKNYLRKLRNPTAYGMVGSPVTRNDESWIYVSKMYFDTMNRSGLYDSNASNHTNAPTNGQRFSQYTYGSWDTHHEGHNGYSGGESNFALDVGYKSQVSLLADFRQVNNNWDGYYPEYTCHLETASNGYNWVGPETYNSGMVMHMTQDMPEGYFDSYYLKIRRNAAYYVDKITVHYSDGETMEVEGSQIKELLGGTTADADQKDYNNAKYFRLNLLKTDASGKHVPSFGSETTNAGEVERTDYYRDPVDDYRYGTVTGAKDGQPNFTVTKVVYDIRINQYQYTNGSLAKNTNRYVDGTYTENAAEGTAVDTPDYGSWFGLSNSDPTNIANQMSLEINGRMYTETAKTGVDYIVDTSMEVGGTNSGNVRPGHEAMVRCDTPAKEAGNAYRSAWSYQDYHRTGTYYSHTHEAARMRHLRSCNRIIALTDSNYTVKGITDANGNAYTELNESTEGRNMTEKGLFGGDTAFNINMYRYNMYRWDTGLDNPSYSSTVGSRQYYPNDWGVNYVSFADKLMIDDVMPWCQPDDDLAYYGFLTMGMVVQGGVATHLKNYEGAYLKFTTKQWGANPGAGGATFNEADEKYYDADGTWVDENGYLLRTDEDGNGAFKIYSETKDAGRTFYVRRDGTYEVQPDGTEQKVSDQGIDYLVSTADGYIQFVRDGEEAHSSLKGKTPLLLNLNVNEFVASYTMDLGPYNGNGDITAESNGLYKDVDRDDDGINVRVFGRPYIYKGQKRPNTNVMNDKGDARNTARVWSYNFNAMDKATWAYGDAQAKKSSDWRAGSGSSITRRNSDTAYYLGYLIDFGYRTSINDAGDRSAVHDLIDYKTDNLTPNSATREVRFWNIQDKNINVDDQYRKAHISSVKLKTSWSVVTPGVATGANPDAIRLQKIYMPAQFVTVGGHARNENWFQAQDFIFTVYNVSTGRTETIALSWNDMVSLGMVSGTVANDAQGIPTFTGSTLGGTGAYKDCYVIDIEKYLRMSEARTALEAEGVTGEALWNALNDASTYNFGLNTAGYIDARRTDKVNGFATPGEPTRAEVEAPAFVSAAKSYVLGLVKPGIVGHYRTVQRTNTLAGADWADDSNVNLEYAAPYVTSLQFTFVSPNADREKPETMLDSGQYLAANPGALTNDGATPDSAGRTTENYVFAYEGVYADRPTDDFRTAKATTTNPTEGNWNYWSTPTFDKQGNGFAGTSMTDYLSVVEVLTRDPNKKKVSSTESDTHRYDLSHRLGALITDMQRGKKVTINDKDSWIFGYDYDDRSISSPVSYDPASGAGSDIPNGDIYAGDYVEYNLYVGAGSADYQVKTNLTSTQYDYNYNNADNWIPVPLQHVDGRFEVQKGQRIVGWEVQKYFDASQNKWVENNTTDLPVTAKLTALDGTVSIDNVAPQTDLSQKDGQEQYDQNRVLLFSIGDAYEASKGNVNNSSQIGLGKGVWIRVITQMTDELETDEDYNSTINRSIQSDNPSYQGTAVQANFYAQAAPLHGFTQYRVYNKSGSLANSSSQNREGTHFANNTAEKGYIAGAHTNGAGVTDNCTQNDASLLKYSTTKDKNVTFFKDDEGNSTNFTQLAARDYSSVVFHKHNTAQVNITPDFYDPQGNGGAGKVDPLSSSNQAANADGNRMRLKVTNIRNTTWHESTMTVTVSFMRAQNNTATGTTGFDADGNPAGVRYFELTEQPTYASTDKGSTFENGHPLVLDYPDTNAPVNSAAALAASTQGPDANLGTLPEYVVPANGAKDKLTERPALKIEYYVPNWYAAATASTASWLDSRESILPITPFATAPAPSSLGAWVTYDELVQKYPEDTDAVTGGTVTTEGHTANGNVFRDVTGVRWTYYDLPATANGTTAFPLDDVSLLGVARYQDTRTNTAGLSAAGSGIEQANNWSPVSQVDVAFTHTDNETTVLDFIDTGKLPLGKATFNAEIAAFTANNGTTGNPQLRANEAVTHNTLTIKQDEGKTAGKTIWRRTPVMRFQSQVFQDEARAKALYNVDAAQKTSYVAGEQLWYKNTLINMPKTQNVGIKYLEGELYNPVFYQMVPQEYVKNEKDGQITAKYLAEHLRIAWYQTGTKKPAVANAASDKDVYAERTNGMKLVVEKVDDYTMPDYGGAMVYNNGTGSTIDEAGRYFNDLNPTAAGVSQETKFTLYKISWVPESQAVNESDDVAIARPATTAAGEQGGSIVDDAIAYDRPADQIMPNHTRMEVGDRIELYFDVYASVDNLPQVYQRNGITNASGVTDFGTGGTAGLEPAYFPRVGEYYYRDYANATYSWTGRISPLSSMGGSSQVYDGSAAYKFETSGILMDMDYLMLDSAFSGDKPEQTDTWEMFDGSYAYIPGDALSQFHYNGYATTNNNWGYNGNGLNYSSAQLSNVSSTDTYYGNTRGRFLDSDIKQTENKQVVRYTPWPQTGTKGTTGDKLPSNVHYLWWHDHNDSAYDNNADSNKFDGLTSSGAVRSAMNNDGGSALAKGYRYVRDWYAYVTKARTNGLNAKRADGSLAQVTGTSTDAEGNTVSTGIVEERWHSVTPLVWSETRLHMQKAWLATSSRFISSAGTTMSNGAATGVSAYEARRQYTTEDTYAGWTTANYDYSDDLLRQYRGVILGQYTTALQYNQDFTSELIAYNYGDRNLDGVEFTYVMPRGVEPILDGTVTEVPGGDDDMDLEEEEPEYKANLTVRFNAEDLEEPIRFSVYTVNGAKIGTYAVAPNKDVLLTAAHVVSSADSGDGDGEGDGTEEGVPEGGQPEEGTPEEGDGTGGAEGDETAAAAIDFDQGDYWIVVESVGTTPEGLPFATGSYTYNTLDKDNNVVSNAASYQPLSFHVTAHDDMEKSNASSEGISVDLSAIAGGEKSVYGENGTAVRLKEVQGEAPCPEDDIITIGTGAKAKQYYVEKVYGLNGAPVRLVKITNEATVPEGAVRVTIGTGDAAVNYYVDEAKGSYVPYYEADEHAVPTGEGKFIAYTASDDDDAHAVSVTTYDSAKASSVKATLGFERIEVASSVSVTVNAPDADPAKPALVQILDGDGKVVEVADADGGTVRFDSVAVTANEKVKLGDLPRGTYRIHFLKSPEMTGDWAAGQSYTLPEDTEFSVVGLGDDHEFEYTLDHIWTESAVTLTVNARHVDYDAKVIITTDAGQVVNPATGETVYADAEGYRVNADGQYLDAAGAVIETPEVGEGEDGTAAEEAAAAQRVKVNRDDYALSVGANAATTLASTLPKGFYFVEMIEAPAMDYSYTKTELVIDAQGKETEQDVTRTGVWNYLLPADGTHRQAFESDGHGTAVALEMTCELAEAPAENAGESVVRIDVSAPEAASDEMLIISLYSVAYEGEGDEAEAVETTVSTGRTIALNRMAFVDTLAPGTYRLYLTGISKNGVEQKDPLYAMPAAPIEFTVAEAVPSLTLDAITLQKASEVEAEKGDGEDADAGEEAETAEPAVAPASFSGETFSAFALSLATALDEAVQASPQLLQMGAGELTEGTDEVFGAAAAEAIADNQTPMAATPAATPVEGRTPVEDGEAFDDATQAEIQAALDAAAGVTAEPAATDEPTTTEPEVDATGYELDGDFAVFADEAVEGTAPSTGVDISASNLAKLAAQIKSGARAYLISNTTALAGNYSQDPQITASWLDISEFLDIEVVQTPAADTNQGYYAPAYYQDPQRSSVAATANTETSTYTSVGVDTAEAGVTNQSEAYRDSSQPWVLKIKVKQELGKWFGRNADSNAANLTDPDTVNTLRNMDQAKIDAIKAALATGGYQIKVTVPSHVFGNNESEKWYDRVMVRPIDLSSAKKVGQDKAAGEEPSRSSAYYQVYDIDHFEGLAKQRKLHIQPYGMDWKFTLQRYYRNTVESQLAGSPNMPAVNGYTVQNNTVRTTDPANPDQVTDVMGRAAANLAFWKKAYKDETTASGPVLYAQTGTDAVMRKPVVRVWNSISLPDVLTDAQVDADGNETAGTQTDGVGKTSANYYLEAETDTRQVNVHVENRFWWDSYTRYYGDNNYRGYVINESRWATYSKAGGQMGDLVLPVVTVVLPKGITPVHRVTRQPYGQWPGVKQEFLYEDWDIAKSEGATWSNQTGVTQNETRQWLEDNFTATVTYEHVTADETEYPAADINNDEYRFVVRFIPKGNDLNGDPSTEQRIQSFEMDTFKFSIAMSTEPDWDEAPAHSEASRVTESIRTYVSSAMTGYKQLIDNNISVQAHQQGYDGAWTLWDPYTVGAVAQYRGAGMGRDHDQRLDAISAAYMTRNNGSTAWVNIVNQTGSYLSTTARNDAFGNRVYTFQWEYDNKFPGSYRSNNYYNYWHDFQTITRLPYNYYNSGTQTNDGVQYSHLIGYFGTYAENAGSTRAGGPRVPLTGETDNKGMNISEFNWRTQYALSEETTNNLNSTATNLTTGQTDTNTAATKTEPFGLRGGVDAEGNERVTYATHTDGGVFTANKLRLKTPTLGSAVEIENTPADRPNDDTVATTASTTTGKGASEGKKLTENGQPFEYDDEVWLAATLSNKSHSEQGIASTSSGQEGKEGALQHAKLVFSMYLPKQVTFYDQNLLKNLGETVTAANYEKLFTDYADDEYAFYIERTYKDRHTDTGVTTGTKKVFDEFTGEAKYPKRSQQQVKYERLTPKQMVEAGWTIKVRVQPDYDADGYIQRDYAKADLDDADDLPASADVKTHSHEGEVVVFELTPPDDASDLEFVKHPSMLSAFWDNVRADGYVGPGDSVTLKVRTRIDNVGDEESAVEGLVDENGDALTYAEQLEAVRTWSAEASKAYFATENQDASWLPQETGWSHTFAKDVTVAIDSAEDAESHVNDDGTVVLAAEDVDNVYVVKRNGTAIVYGPNGYPEYDLVAELAAEDGTYTFKAGETYLKPTVAANSLSSFGTEWFNNQSPLYFQWAAGTVRVEDKLGHLDADTGEEVPDVDYDRDGKDTAGDERQKPVLDENGEPQVDENGDTVTAPVSKGFTETHLTNTSGTFEIRKPSASVRADTGVTRAPTDDQNAVDSTQSGSNDLYVTQAINTGAAINSFVVDWEVPLWALGSQSAENAPLNSSTTPVGKVTPSITSVKTGVWEMPGTTKWQVTNPVTDETYDTAEGVHYFDENGKEVGAWRVNFKNVKRVDGVTYYRYHNGPEEEDLVCEMETVQATDEDGNPKVDENGDPIMVEQPKLEENGRTPVYKYVRGVAAKRVNVDTPEAEANRAIEKQLWTFVYVRRNVTDPTKPNNGYVEQNANFYQDRENFALPGADADRDYFYGEDDTVGGKGSSDYNTADDAAGTWMLVGYARVSDKVN